MKKYLSGLITGIALTTLVGSLIIGASAISSKMTIEVDPINIQVNGEIFQPKDEHGNEVPVFAYGGTTYAPLRALAKAYGLEVGYDKEANMASVTDRETASEPTTAPDTTAKADYSDWSAEDEAAYQEFKGMWKYTTKENTADWLPTMTYIGTMQEKDLVQFLNQYEETTLIKYAIRARTDFVIDSPTSPLSFRTSDNRGLFSVHPDGTIRYGSIFSYFD